jgi:acyl-CoA synthetase (NDP forming)
VLPCSGGASGAAPDGAAELGIDLPALSAPTRERLAELLPEAATIGNPLDYTALIWGEADLLAALVETVGADDAIDQLLLLYDQPEDADDSWSEVRAGLIAGARAAAGGTLVASTLPDLLDHDAAIQFADQGVPAIAGLRSALRAARALRAPAGDPARLREVAAAARRARSASNGAGWLGEAEVKAILREAGVTVPAGDVAADAGAAETLADRLGYPVALKLSGPHVQHKSEIGAIELGLNRAQEVRDAFARLEQLPAAAGASVLVERMAGSGAELLVAARADGVVPALVVGVGGIWTEALDDVAIVPLPAGPERVEEALRSLRAGPLLAGARGGEPPDVVAAAELAARAGELLLDRGLSLLELNPVVAGSQGAVVLDAVAR